VGNKTLAVLTFAETITVMKTWSEGHCKKKNQESREIIETI